MLYCHRTLRQLCLMGFKVGCWHLYTERKELDFQVLTTCFTVNHAYTKYMCTNLCAHSTAEGQSKKYFRLQTWIKISMQKSTSGFVVQRNVNNSEVEFSLLVLSRLFLKRIKNFNVVVRRSIPKVKYFDVIFSISNMVGYCSVKAFD